MKKYFFVIVCTVMFCGGVFLSAALGQDEIIVLNSSELGRHQRPLVSFKHEMHAEEIECLRCHHEYDDYGVNSGGDGQRCAECHTASAGSNPVPLMRAFHLQCKGCHQKLSKTGDTKPRMCGQCHSRK